MEAKIEKIKSHLKENKKGYLIAGASILSGVILGAGGVVLANRADVLAVQKINALVVVKPTQTLTQETILMLVKETGEKFASKNRLSETLGVNRSELADIAPGESGKIGNYTVENLGKAA